MRVEYDLGTLAPVGPAVLTMGAFDGVHRGHRQLATRAAELAREQGARAIAITFWPHPEAVVRPDSRLTLLTTLAERLDLLASLDLLDATVVLPFTDQMAALEPEAFLDTLGAWCRPVAFIEGPDFAFGHRRAGTLDFLRAAGARRGFTVEALEVRDGEGGATGERVSSTRIRTLVSEGAVEQATRLLGHAYSLTGEVVGGDRRGRLLGFPTANLRLDDRKLLPALGIYAVRVRLPGETAARHPGVASIGVRPQFKSERNVLAEVHLLDATMDLYGLTIETELVARLREERRFASVEALVDQMRRDAQEARDVLAAAHLPFAARNAADEREDARTENNRSTRHGRDE